VPAEAPQHQHVQSQGELEGEGVTGMDGRNPAAGWQEALSAVMPTVEIQKSTINSDVLSRGDEVNILADEGLEVSAWGDQKDQQDQQEEQVDQNEELEEGPLEMLPENPCGHEIVRHCEYLEQVVEPSFVQQITDVKRLVLQDNREDGYSEIIERLNWTKEQSQMDKELARVREEEQAEETKKAKKKEKKAKGKAAATAATIPTITIATLTATRATKIATETAAKQAAVVTKKVEELKAANRIPKHEQTLQYIQLPRKYSEANIFNLVKKYEKVIEQHYDITYEEVRELANKHWEYLEENMGKQRENNGKTWENTGTKKFTRGEVHKRELPRGSEV
jgi:hypothetical protein